MNDSDRGHSSTWNAAAAVVLASLLIAGSMGALGFCTYLFLAYQGEQAATARFSDVAAAIGADDQSYEDPSALTLCDDGGFAGVVAAEKIAADSAGPLPRALDYLASQQSPDGGLKSTTYGPLKWGAAETTLFLYAAAHVPDEQRRPYASAIDKAFAFLQTGLNEHGAVAAPDGTLDYPTYSAAMLLTAVDRLRLELTAEQKAMLIAGLLAAQVTEAQEAPPESDHYGGWDMEAASGAGGDQLKGSNIALTSFALEALSRTMNGDAQAAIRRALPWVRRCQNSDGGFVFHVWRPHPGNKAMWNDDEQLQAISYGTPTCDGLRCL
ncbi:MAG: terpene cyclase/mutase family protein, partial [Planctomycetales bacterium]|nr:terpene cyclase/mutase family protein [Planctomycetales bacterium]